MTAAHFASMSPKARRMLITVCAMTATIMQALDTTIANVALLEGDVLLFQIDQRVERCERRR